MLRTLTADIGTLSPFNAAQRFRQLSRGTRDMPSASMPCLHLTLGV